MKVIGNIKEKVKKVLIKFFKNLEEIYLKIILQILLLNFMKL